MSPYEQKSSPEHQSTDQSLSLSQLAERFQELLDCLCSNVDATCVILTNPDGILIAQSGQAEEFPFCQIAPLLGGGMATMLEVGRILDGGAQTINLAYREGSNTNLYVIYLREKALMMILVPVGAYNSRLGTVWYYAQQAALKLLELLVEESIHEPMQALEQENLNQDLDYEFYRILLPSVQAKLKTTSDPVSMPGRKPANLVDKKNSKERDFLKGSELVESNLVLLSFEEAIQNGIIAEQFRESSV